MNHGPAKPLNKKWMASFKRDKKLEDYLEVGEPLANNLSAKGPWRKLAVNCSAIECQVVFRHEKLKKKLYVIVRGKGGEFANFAEALGEVMFLSDRIGHSDWVGIAFPASLRGTVVSHAKNMTENWKKLHEHFNCSEMFFVNLDGTVEQVSWMSVLKIKT